jgi:hypothetical protein
LRVEVAMIFTITREIFDNIFDDIDEADHFHENGYLFGKLFLSLAEFSSVEALVTIVHSVFFALSDDFGSSQQFIHSLE